MSRKYPHTSTIKSCAGRDEKKNGYCDENQGESTVMCSHLGFARIYTYTERSLRRTSLAVDILGGRPPLT